MVMDCLTVRMDFASILSAKRSVTNGSVKIWDGNGDGMCKQILTLSSRSSPTGVKIIVQLCFDTQRQFLLVLRLLASEWNIDAVQYHREIVASDVDFTL